MNKKDLLSCAAGVMICVLIITAGCKKNSEVEEVVVPPSGVLLASEGCKEFQTGGSNPAAGVSVAQTSDCIDYRYDGKGTLTLTHINAAFNCCPGEITAEITFNGNVITIKEAESEQACRCDCLFDLDYELINLPPGTYWLQVIEPYVQESDQELAFTLRLSSATSGSHCVERNYYPWVLL